MLGLLVLKLPLDGLLLQKLVFLVNLSIFVNHLVGSIDYLLVDLELLQLLVVVPLIKVKFWLLLFLEVEHQFNWLIADFDVLLDRSLLLLLELNLTSFRVLIIDHLPPVHVLLHVYFVYRDGFMLDWRSDFHVQVFFLMVEQHSNNSNVVVVNYLVLTYLWWRWLNDS